MGPEVGFRPTSGLTGPTGFSPHVPEMGLAPTSGGSSDPKVALPCTYGFTGSRGMDEKDSDEEGYGPDPDYEIHEPGLHYAERNLGISRF